MLRIGKNPTNDLVIKDRAAEDFHCILYISQGDVILEDLKSHYGTLVNGTKITHAKLIPGDELQIGFTRVEWQKLIPALEAIGDTMDAESFLQSQDLNLEVRDVQEFTDDVSEPFSFSKYRLDSQPDLIAQVQKIQEQPEIEYSYVPVTPPESLQKPKIEEVIPVEQVTPIPIQIDSEPDQIQEKQMAQPNSDKQHEHPNDRKASKSDLRTYYYVLIGMLAAMVLSAIFILRVTA